MSEAIQLTDIIAPAFYPVHWDILDGKHTYYDLYGGRGSTKSSFISVEIVLGMMQDKNANAVVFHKYSVMLRDSVYNQVQWAIDALGATDYWKGSVSPMQFVYIPTGQKIIFRGLDKALKIAREIPKIPDERIVVLPEGVKPGTRVYEIYRFLGKGAWEVDVHQFRLEDIPKMGKTVFTSMEQADNAIERAKKKRC